MKRLLILLIATVAFSQDYSEEWHNSGNVVHGNNTYNVTNNYVVPTDTVIVTETVTDTIRISTNTEPVIMNKLIASVGVQYSVPFTDDMNITNGFGFKGNVLLATSDARGTIGVRAGYSRFNDENLFEISGMFGIKYAQIIVGWGIYSEVSGTLVGLNFTMPTKIGLTASFNNFLSDNLYVPEVGVGITFNIGEF